MPATLAWNPDLGILEVQLTGRLNQDDYEKFAPEFDLRVKRYGGLRVLVTLHEFQGWTFRGLWEDIKFDYQHCQDIDRLAIVGEKRWHEAMAAFCKPFTTAKIRYFERFEWIDAREWLLKESAQPAVARSTSDSPAEE